MSSDNFAGDNFNTQLPHLDIKYFRNFLSEEEALQYFQKLYSKINWQQYNIKIFGKTLPQPRLTAFYAETEQSYTYSGLTLLPLSYTSELKTLHKLIELVTPARFTHCLANLYRDGRDSMGLHADDEKELGEYPVIASLSLGATRKLRFKHKHNKSLKLDLDLEPGSLLIMGGKTQHFWKHELTKTSRSIGPRINLTFRKILS